MVSNETQKVIVVHNIFFIEGHDAKKQCFQDFGLCYQCLWAPCIVGSECHGVGIKIVSNAKHRADTTIIRFIIY